MAQSYCTAATLKFQYLWNGKIKTQEINPQIDNGAIGFFDNAVRGEETIGGLAISGFCLTNRQRRTFFFSRIQGKIEVSEIEMDKC